MQRLLKLWWPGQGSGNAYLGHIETRGSLDCKEVKNKTEK
jgi:hypothetical protein